MKRHGQTFIKTSQLFGEIVRQHDGLTLSEIKERIIKISMGQGWIPSKHLQGIARYVVTTATGDHAWLGGTVSRTMEGGSFVYHFHPTTYRRKEEHEKPGPSPKFLPEEPERERGDYSWKKCPFIGAKCLGLSCAIFNKPRRRCAILDTAHQLFYMTKRGNHGF